MKILWMGQKPYDGGAGEEVVDHKLKSALIARGHQITDLHLLPVSRAAEVVNLAIRGIPYYRHRFASARNLRAVRNIPRSFDVALASWEPFDRLALEAPIPVVLLLHNITSSAIRSVFPTHPLARHLARRAELSERRVYADRRLRAIATLSSRDHAYVSRIAGGVPVAYTPPGMPPAAALRDDAPVLAELLLSGSYGWFPKRRDIRAFAREYANLPGRLPVIATDLPQDAEALLSPRPVHSAAADSAIRFGVISDRFQSGHKLKTTYYIANNAIVLSFADVSDDFAALPDHDFFIRRVTRVEEIAHHVAAVQAEDPAHVRARLRAFQQRCAEIFSWQRSADRLAEVLSAS